MIEENFFSVLCSVVEMKCSHFPNELSRMKNKTWIFHICVPLPKISYLETAKMVRTKLSLGSSSSFLLFAKRIPLLHCF